MYKFLPNLTRGMNRLSPPDSIEDGESPYISNLIFGEGVLKSETGYATWGSTVRGYPQRVYQLFKKAGTSVLLLITTSTLYKWISDEWQYVSDSNESTVSGNHGTGATTLVVASTASFGINYSNGTSTYIGITLSDGTQHQTTVNAVSGPHWITMTTAFPSTATCAHGAQVVEAVPLEGTVNDPVSCAVWVPDDDLVFTNNQDKVKLYDSSEDECKNVPNMVSTGDCVAKIVRVFNYHLCLYGTVEGGTDYPQRVRWCNIAELSNWATGTSGYEDLWTAEDEIKAAEHLGPSVIVYKDKEIIRQSYVGTTATVFGFNTLLVGRGAAGSSAVAALGDCHYVLSLEGIYRYDGSYTVYEAGAKMRPYLFGRSGTINPSYAIRALCFYVPEMREVWFLVPIGTDTEVSLLVRYNRDTDGWVLRPLTHDLCGYGLYQTVSGRTWNELVGSWAEQEWKWNESRMLSGSPEVMLCGYSPLQVYEYDYTTIGDNGTTIDWEFQTGDFHNPSKYLRMNLVEFFANGTTVSVNCSSDKGTTWKELEEVTLSSTRSRHRVWHQEVARQLRYKFAGSGGNFELEWLGVDYEESSKW